MNLHKFSISRQKKNVPLGTSFRLHFIQQLDDFCNLLLAFVLISGLKRILHAAGKMSAKNLSLCLMHQRFHRLQLSTPSICPRAVLSSGSTFLRSAII